MFYSPSQNGFYDPAIHGDNIPADAVEITREQHAALIEGQSQGKVIAADADGQPVLQDPPKPTLEQVVASALKTIETFARDVRHQIAGTSDDAEIAGWNNKLRIAKAVLDKTATESEIQAMATEAQARGDGKTAEELAAIVVAKGEKFAVVVGLIDGMKRKAGKAVEAAKTPAEVEAVLDAMRKEADAALEQLKA
jgi:hypothetical protein